MKQMDFDLFITRLQSRLGFRQLFTILLATLLFVFISAEASMLSNSNDGVEDRDEFYFSSQGVKIQLYRKRDTYVSVAKTPLSSSVGKRTVAFSVVQHEVIKSREWPNYRFIQTGASSQAHFSASSPVAQLRAPKGFRPVFTDSSGASDILLLPELFVHLSSPLSNEQVLDLANAYGLKLKRRLAFSTQDILLSPKGLTDAGGANYSRMFEISRNLSRDPRVDWSEPNMITQLHHTALSANLLSASSAAPNDHLYSEQWSLFNWGKGEQLCDADIDMPPAWDLTDNLNLTTPVIAIVDDGVQLDHPDLLGQLWTNPSPGSNNCEGDLHGCDFTHSDPNWNGSGVLRYGTQNGTQYQPIPQSANDTHGTRVAGLALAQKDNQQGLAGAAINGQLMSVKVDFSGTSCDALADALQYAGQKADILNLSWRLGPDPDAFGVGFVSCYAAVNSALDSITKPIVAASGNQAAGWRKVSIPVEPLAVGQSSIKLAFYKDAFEDGGQDAVWVDDITLPGSTPISFDSNNSISSPLVAGGGIAQKTGGQNATLSYSACAGGNAAAVSLQSSADINQHRFGNVGKSIRLSPNSGQCAYLEINQNITQAGDLTFWVWVSAEPWFLSDDWNAASQSPGTDGVVDAVNGDPFKVFIKDGLRSTVTEVELSLNNADDEGISSIFHDIIDFPASHINVIAVGASDDGSITGAEGRAYFSQYSDKLDVVAPGMSLKTTAINSAYANFTGTSAATPLVSGVVANMLSVNPALTPSQIKQFLRNGADQKGVYSYTSNRNIYYGSGRANAYKSLKLALSQSIDEPQEQCADPNPANDSICFPIKSKGSGLAIVCL